MQRRNTLLNNFKGKSRQFTHNGDLGIVKGGTQRSQFRSRDLQFKKSASLTSHSRSMTANNPYLKSESMHGATLGLIQTNDLHIKAAKAANTMAPSRHSRQQSNQFGFKTDQDEVHSSSRPSSALGKQSEASQTEKYARIKLVVRVRPLLNGEKKNSKEKTISIDTAQSAVALQSGYAKTTFKFDAICGSNCDQEDTFQATIEGIQQSSAPQSKITSRRSSTNELSFKMPDIEPSVDIVTSFLNGNNATIFAYGQTGAGKTYTIIGGKQKKVQSHLTQSLQNNKDRGILPRILDQIFSFNDQTKLQLSYYEIYNERIYDLFTQPKLQSNAMNFNTMLSSNTNQKADRAISLNRTELHVREEKGRFTVPELRKVTVTTLQQAYELLRKGLMNRQVSQTKGNTCSSRSHTIFQIHSQTKAILSVVDLAGSEKYSVSEQEEGSQLRMQEMNSINTSLSVLGHVIQNMSALPVNNKRRHIPFRDSKLTKLLKDSLIGSLRASVIFIVCVSPSVESYSETQSTLQFADRAKKAVIYIEKKPKELSNEENIYFGHSRRKNQLLKLQESKAAEFKKTLQEDQISKFDSLISKFNVLQQQQTELEQNNAYEDMKAVNDTMDSIIDELANLKQENAQLRGQVGAYSQLIELIQNKNQQQMEGNAADLSKPALKSCIKSGKQKRLGTSPGVRFVPILDNNTSLDSAVRERIEHNLKYKDDTIFQNLDIFRDLTTEVKKVTGKKDNFNAKSLLATKPEDIPVSDDEDGAGIIVEQKLLDEAGSLSFTDFECIENKAINNRQIHTNSIYVQDGPSELEILRDLDENPSKLYANNLDEFSLDNKSKDMFNRGSAQQDMSLTISGDEILKTNTNFFYAPDCGADISKDFKEFANDFSAGIPQKQREMNDSSSFAVSPLFNDVEGHQKQQTREFQADGANISRDLSQIALVQEDASNFMNLSLGNYGNNNQQINGSGEEIHFNRNSPRLQAAGVAGGQPEQQSTLILDEEEVGELGKSQMQRSGREARLEARGDDSFDFMQNNKEKRMTIKDVSIIENTELTHSPETSQILQFEEALNFTQNEQARKEDSFKQTPQSIPIKQHQRSPVQASPEETPPNERALSLTNTFSTIKSMAMNLEKFVCRSGRLAPDSEDEEQKSPTPFMPVDAYEDFDLNKKYSSSQIEVYYAKIQKEIGQLKRIILTDSNQQLEDVQQASQAPQAQGSQNLNAIIDTIKSEVQGIYKLKNEYDRKCLSTKVLSLLQELQKELQEQGGFKTVKKIHCSPEMNKKVLNEQSVLDQIFAEEQKAGKLDREIQNIEMTNNSSFLPAVGHEFEESRDDSLLVLLRSTNNISPTLNQPQQSLVNQKRLAQQQTTAPEQSKQKRVGLQAHQKQQNTATKNLKPGQVIAPNVVSPKKNNQLGFQKVKIASNKQSQDKQVNQKRAWIAPKKRSAFPQKQLKTQTRQQQSEECEATQADGSIQTPQTSQIAASSKQSVQQYLKQWFKKK